MKKIIPTYRIVVNEEDESGVYAVSLVDEPAIEVNWIHLSKIVEMEFAANKDKQMLFGPLLIPNKLIFRRDEKGNEYNIMFDEDTIQIIADKFNSNKLGDVFNFQHSDKTVEAILLQNWITGDIDKSQEYGFSLPKGTWFGGVKVKDKSFWLNDVKSGKVKGFSVEIKAGIELVELNKTNIKTKLMEIKRNDGVSIYYDGELALGTSLFLDEAMTEAAPEGEHTLEDGRIILILEGKLDEIKDAVELADVSKEEDAVDTKLELNAEEVMAIVQPELEAIRNGMVEILAKLAELEASLSNDNDNAIEELKSQVEKLSSLPAVTSISIKNDKVAAKNVMLLNKINTFKKSTK